MGQHLLTLDFSTQKKNTRGGWVGRGKYGKIGIVSKTKKKHLLGSIVGHLNALKSTIYASLKSKRFPR